jgi:indole-3-glycerol phosphate synthase
MRQGIRYSTVEEVVKGYENAGACGISVLADGKYLWQFFR